MELDDLVSNVNTNLQSGITQKEAEKRLKEYGPNQLKQKKAVSPWQIFINQFKNIIIFLLIAATIISILLGETIEAAAIAVVIVLNAILGFITEYRAEQAMDALKKMVPTKAKILRDNKIIKIEAKKVIPGDILILEEGDKVTADGRLAQADNLTVIEAPLTGESEPVSKKTQKLDDPDENLGDRVNMVYMGTAVARGSGKAVVIATSKQTEMGNITQMLEETEETETPLEKKMAHLSHTLVYITLSIAAIVAVLGLLTGKEIVSMFYTALALAISAVPEGLPAVATITLAIGMNRMAKQKAIIRVLPAVETLGSTTIICSDKTGTITENEMTLDKIWLPGKHIKVTGKGYKPEGEFLHDNNPVKPGNDDDLKNLLRAGLLCSTASLQKNEKDKWEIAGDPTEGALIVAARKAGIERNSLLENGYKQIRKIPFSSEEKRMAIYYELPEGKQIVYVKGASSVILNSCNKILQEGKQSDINDDLKKEIENNNNKMGKTGLRILALAYKEVTGKNDDPYSRLTFLGLAGMFDPPREEATDAIAEAKKAGIQTKIITGDQPSTAAAIGKRIGLLKDKNENAILHGKELARISQEDLMQKIKNTRIFARVSPENKLDIVKALQKKGEIVAMTGDGVNDAPALKKANIGISMGISGTMVAREASSMVLSDDNYATIVKAVKQGRVIFTNIKKFIHYLFSCNLSEILVIFLSIVAGFPVPLLVLHLLWLNLVTDVFPALSLGFEPPEKGVMSTAPRDPGEKILTRPFQWKIGIQGVILSLAAFSAYIYSFNIFSLEAARTITFLTLAFGQIVHVLNVRKVNGFGLDRSLLNNKVMLGGLTITIILQLFAVYVPFLNYILTTVPPTLSMWIIVITASLVPVILIQAANLLPFVQEGDRGGK
ncbi:MAG: HAD-IC family P-type ATPase [Clostridiales bacterium]|nr:HAD-IC family P-type ATPase [Clostridiales bacterium]MCF8021326.1 HAD-IC family P-type ATPase [Clostridiales bacterium]